MLSDDDVQPECAPADVDVAVTWQAEGDGLSGSVFVRNVGSNACRVTGKPAVIPLGVDGLPLGVQTVVTLELRRPDHVVLHHGEQAEARISWSGWNGPEAGGLAIVVWGREGYRKQVVVTGGPQPASLGPPTNMSSSWFRISG